MVTRWFAAAWVAFALTLTIIAFAVIRHAESAEPPPRSRLREAADRKARPYWPWLGTRQAMGYAPKHVHHQALTKIHHVLQSGLFPGQQSQRHVRISGSGRHTYHVELESGLKYSNGTRAFRMFIADDNDRLFQLRGSYDDHGDSEYDIQWSLAPMSGETFDRSLLLKSHPDMGEQYMLTERFRYNAQPMRSISPTDREVLERHEVIELSRSAKPPFQVSRRNPVIVALSQLIGAQSLDLGVDPINGTLQVLFYGEKYPLAPDSDEQRKRGDFVR